MIWLDQPPYVMRHTCRDCPIDCPECSWSDESCTCQIDHSEEDDGDE